jgi:transcriptional regulator with GAF, ATPase, and Fis domain
LDLIDHKRGLLHENAALAQRHSARDAIVGQSPQILTLIEQLRRVARLPRPVLITGERGTGKELIARAIHEESPRAEARLLTVNCAAFSDSLLENELFGHERGGFSGADKRARGLFELAHGGTLFLDEISNTTLSFQQKILRVVEYGRFTRVGGSREIESSARVVAATNVDLKQRIADKLFLPDLYDRLAFEVIHVPPLRQRPGDDLG